MTLYFDSKVQFLDADAISTIGRWHPNEPLFSIASYSQDRGGSVTIFDDSGEPLRDITYPVHPVSQATALCWHPEKALLTTGWENGEIHSWYNGNREFSSIQGPHKAPIILLEFSEKGGRMVTADSMGLLTGWRCDDQNQFLTMFSHDLRDTLLHITFRRTIENPIKTEITNLAKAAVAGDENALDVLTNWRPRTAAKNFANSLIKDNHCFYVGTQSGIIYYVNQGGTCTEILRTDSSPITQLLWHPKRDAVVTLMEDMTVGHYLVESNGNLTELDRVKLSGKIPGNNGAISWAANCLAIITGDFSVRIWNIDTSENFLLTMELPNTGRTTSATVASDFSLMTDIYGISDDGTYMNSSFRQQNLYHQEDSITITGGNNSSSGGGGGVGSGSGGQTNEIFTCISYCQENQTLCAGTNQGNLYTWKKTTNYAIDVPENSWQLNNISAVRGAIKQCYWGISSATKPCIMVNCISNVYVLKEQPLISFHQRNIWAVQRSANQIYVEHSCGKSTTIHADISITNLSLTEYNLILSNGRTIVTYKISKDDDLSSGNDKNLSIKQLQSFNTECHGLYIHDQNIFCLTMTDVKIYSLGGVILKEIKSNDNEGKVIGFDLTGHYLTVFTINGYIKLFDVSRHEPKILFHPKSGYDLFENFGEIIMAKCNINGTHLAITIANENLIPDGRIYIWDFEKDIKGYYDFLRKLEKSVDTIENDSFVPRLPITFNWDTDDNRLFAVEARSIQQPKRKFTSINSEKKTTMTITTSTNDSNSNDNNNSNRQLGEIILSGGSGGIVALSATISTVTPIVTGTTASISTNKSDNSSGYAGGGGGSGVGIRMSRHLNDSNLTESVVFVMFTTDKCLIKELETVNLTPGEQLVNLCSPHVIALNINVITEIALRDFKGMENCDATTRKMILDFSLYVAQGNMDQAFRCIRSIQSDVVWENLAKMCVQTGRLDVAKVCLGHLKKARSVRALRKAMEDNSLEKDAKIAVLAIELGMIEEAEILYKKCGRYDLLNKLLQARGKIDEAIQVAEQGDRVNLKNTYFRKAEELKEKGDVKGAIEFYEKTQNPVYGITQMLLNDPIMLKKYMQNTTDPKMLKWWGQYVESTGDMESALKIYQKAEDWFSQVKILCYLQKLSKADTIARQCGDRAACYHLARHYENIGKYQEAIQFYTRAQTYSNAVRICKENDLQEELWQVANSARAHDKAIAAAYFEECGNYKNAVDLYHRAGLLHKAVEMAFASQQPEILQVIASELNSESDPDLVNRCAEFFMSIEQHQKAVQLLARAKQYEKALEICSERGVPITESLAELLTPSKDQMVDNVRNKILQKLGELLQEQGDYHTATKKFTQAGDKVRAMKSLLKSGDTDKIIFFAGMSRQREVYIMAANYLQALNWQNDSKILKHIVTFYSKGQAYDSLANFYATCAQVEIDEFRDYEKALKAMHEAGKCLGKVPNIQRAAENLQKTIIEVKNVLSIQEALENGDNQVVIAGCRNMLVKPEKPPIRHSHILAMLIQALVSSKLYVEANGALRELAMKDPTWNSRGLLEKSLVQKIAIECNLDFETIWNSGKSYNSTSESINDGDNQENARNVDDDDDDDGAEIQEEFE